MRPNDKPIPTELSLSSLHPFPNHPYKVTDDEAMFALMDSIEEVRQSLVLALIVYKTARYATSKERGA